MKITPEVVSHIARLSRIRLSSEEHKLFTEQLNQILAYMDKLNKLDTQNVEPTSHVLPLKNVLREDKISPSLPPEKIFSNAPDKDGRFFKVPRIIE